MAAQTTKNSEAADLRPKITVIGVGGAGGNAVNNMIRSKLEGVKFLVANTDAQALCQSLVDEPNRLQLGLSVTQGLGAGAKPEVGRASAEETLDEVLALLKGSNMVFITAGMGGGTGTGAAPTIAKAAREIGILTIGVVTKPFHFEGRNRMKLAESGIDELQQYVDTLIVIPNQNLFRIANENTTFADAFRLADDVLYSGVRGVTDLMMMPGLINLDFADIRTVMAEMGKAMMGTGEAEGSRRALDAAESAISNPLLDDVSMKGAKGVLINITGGYDMTLYEVDEAANRIRDEVDMDANIIFGSTFDERLNGTIRVSVVATGIGPLTAATATPQTAAQAPMREPAELREAGFFANNTSFGNPFVPTTAEIQPQPAQATPPTPADMTIPTLDLFSQESLTNQQAATVETPPATEIEVSPILDASLESAPPPAAPAASTPTPPEAPERRRPISLFERFTGVGRAKPQVPEPAVKAKAEETDPNEIDFLEIPAFLRKGNGGGL